MPNNNPLGNRGKVVRLHYYDALSARVPLSQGVVRLAAEAVLAREMGGEVPPTVWIRVLQTMVTLAGETL